MVPVASIRFAWTNSFSESFNIPAGIEYSGKIGWINYVIALILVTLLIAIPKSNLVFGFILLWGSILPTSTSAPVAILGFVIAFILIILTLAPLFAVFQAQYMTRLHDSAESQK